MVSESSETKTGGRNKMKYSTFLFLLGCSQVNPVAVPQIKSEADTDSPTVLACQYDCHKALMASGETDYIGCMHNCDRVAR